MSDNKKIEIKVNSWDAKIEFDILDLIAQLDDEGKKRVCDYFTFDHIFDSLERQLKHKTDLDSWDTSGWRDGQSIRAFILKIQGLEPEFQKDLESKIRSLQHDVDNYKKYYDWYFRLHHQAFNNERYPQEESIMQMAKRVIGDVK